MAYFRVVWRKQRSRLDLPKLNSYPVTPQAYYDGYYPGSSAVRSNRVEFKREIQLPLELNNYPQITVANEYPAPGDPKANRIKFNRVIQKLPKLNEYPATSIPTTEPITAWLGHFEPTRNKTNRRHLRLVGKIYIPNTGFYPAFIRESANQSSFERQLKSPPEHNTYPQTLVGYYEGYYPGSSLAKSHRVWFKRKRLTVELDEYPISPTVAAITPIGRTYLVASENRIYPVDSEDRTYKVPNENRIYPVDES